MANQDKSKFQLNKGTDHGFDISKGGKRKFDLSKDDDEQVVTHAVAPQPAATVNPVNPTPCEPQQKKNKKWPWLILAIVVIVLLIWWLLPGKSTESEPVIEKETIEEVTTPADSTEKVSENVEIPVGEEAKEENVNNDETSVASELVESTPVATSVPTTSQSTINANDSNASSLVSNDVEAEAIKVIRGEYGIGQERKNKLGNKYEAIQRRVNELKREGAF